MADLPPEIADHFRAKRRETRQSLAAIRAALRSGDARQFRDAFSRCLNNGRLPQALRVIAGFGPASDEIRSFFVAVWFDCGDDIRAEAGSDAVLIKALRALLPPYDGPAMTLYRGQGRLSHSSQRLGICWSANLSIAEGFAQGYWQCFTEGGSVVLQVEASAHAIVSTLAVHGYDEDEYIVDPGMLRNFRVVASFDQRAALIEESTPPSAGEPRAWARC